MSELDFGQKLDMRKAFWAAGSSTRLDVRLGALIDPARSRSRARAEDWTDLDVLGVSYSPIAGPQFVVADCKTAKNRVTERVFWLRGVADLFGAQAAYLTRDTELPEAARQLGLRLGIATFDARDRAAFLEQLGEDRLPKAGGFLERDTIRRWMTLTQEVPEATAPLQRYRQTFYWLLPPRRNLTHLPAALRAVAKHFSPDQRWARALLVDLAWLYLVALLTALEEVTRLRLAEPGDGLTQAIVGSELEKREKQRLAALLADLFTRIDPEARNKLPKVPILPEYFEDLLELATRLSRRRIEVTGALRVLEFTTVETIAGTGARWFDAFPGSEPREVKLASDVVRFLARSAGLSGEFLTLFDEATATARSQEAAKGLATPTPSAGVATPAEPSSNGAGHAAAPRGLFDETPGPADDAPAPHAAGGPAQLPPDRLETSSAEGGNS